MAAITHALPQTGILRTKSEPTGSVSGRDLHGRRNAICFPNEPLRLRRRNAICEALDSVSVQCLAEFRLGRMLLWMPGGGQGDGPDGFEGIAFNAFAWSQDEICRCLQWVLCDSDLFRSYCLDAALVMSFIRHVRMGYGKYANPYHCFRHAFDVTQFCYLLLTTGEARHLLTSDQCLGLIIAAICHDLEHPGTDFAFQDAITSHLATQYRGQESPLEAHHLACTGLILNEPGSDILGHLPEERRNAILDVIEQCILATDMGRHGEILGEWRAVIGSECVPDVLASADGGGALNVVILRLLMKMADVSNVCRPWSVSVQWSQKLIDELMRVHDSVLGLGHLPNSFLSSIASEPDQVVGSFTINVARPLLENVIEFLPLAGPLLSILDTNALRYTQSGFQ